MLPDISELGWITDPTEAQRPWPSGQAADAGRLTHAIDALVLAASVPLAQSFSTFVAITGT